MKIVRIVTHHEDPERASELYYEEGVIAVGWSDFGNLKGLSKEEIKEISQDIWERTPAESASDASQLLMFRDDVDIGDIVLAYRTNNIVAMIGEVIGKYQFDEENKVGDPNGDVGYANQKEVSWWEKPRNFNRTLLPKPLDDAVALPGTIGICVYDYDLNKLVEGLRNKGLEVKFKKKRSFWLEKTIVENRPDREAGEYSLGKALWSPQADRRGADIYSNMRVITKGDIILHLIDNDAIVGVSIVEKECDASFTCLPGTEWDDGTGNRPGYLIKLRNYQLLSVPIGRDDILNEDRREELKKILENNLNVFYTRDLELRQGAYITKIPLELLTIINDEYKNKTGNDLPYLTTLTNDSSHLVYKIAWHPGNYKGGFCGDENATACEAFNFIKRNKAGQPCKPGVFHCIDENEVFAEKGWQVLIHPPRHKNLNEISEGNSLLFLTAPMSKSKTRYRLIGFYTIDKKIFEEGKVIGFTAIKDQSSKFQLDQIGEEYKRGGIYNFFGISRWKNPRTAYNFINSENAVNALKKIYDMHIDKEIIDPDVNLDAIQNAIKRFSTISLRSSPSLKLTLHDYFKSKNFLFDEAVVSAFYTALKTKGFVILAGLTGTGKTKLPQLFYRLVRDEPYQELFLPVRPDWRDSKPIIGYYNPIESKYESKYALKHIMKASDVWNSDSKQPFFVLLDEMNLARVEYYFADFLSVLESGRNEDEPNQWYTTEALKLHSLKEKCEDRDGTEIESELYLPPNLYFVGTVNLDETTYSFSPKVLDRAFVIEFWKVNLEDYPPKTSIQTSEEMEQELKARILEDLSRNGRYLAFQKSESNSAIAVLGEYYVDLKVLNSILDDYSMHFGYRVMDEIALFYTNAEESSKKGIIHFDSPNQVIDVAILMKVLPKFHGNRSKLETPLLAVLAWSVDPNNHSDVLASFKNSDGTLKQEYGQTFLEGPEKIISKIKETYSLKYPKTAEKTARMIYQLHTTGFACFL